MELYDKLTAHYPTKYFSVSTTQTVIEEESSEAILREVTIIHNGTEVLLVHKSFLEDLRTGKIQIAVSSAVKDKESLPRLPKVLKMLSSKGSAEMPSLMTPTSSVPASSVH